jgi:hypothetical protein
MFQHKGRIETNIDDYLLNISKDNNFFSHEYNEELILHPSITQKKIIISLDDSDKQLYFNINGIKLHDVFTNQVGNCYELDTNIDFIVEKEESKLEIVNVIKIEKNDKPLILKLDEDQIIISSLNYSHKISKYISNLINFEDKEDNIIYLDLRKTIDFFVETHSYTKHYIIESIKLIFCDNEINIYDIYYDVLNYFGIEKTFKIKTNDNYKKINYEKFNLGIPYDKLTDSDCYIKSSLFLENTINYKNFYKEDFDTSLILTSNPDNYEFLSDIDFGPHYIPIEVNLFSFSGSVSDGSWYRRDINYNIEECNLPYSLALIKLDNYIIDACNYYSYDGERREGYREVEDDIRLEKYGVNSEYDLCLQAPEFSYTLCNYYQRNYGGINLLAHEIYCNTQEIKYGVSRHIEEYIEKMESLNKPTFFVKNKVHKSEVLHSFHDDCDTHVRSISGYVERIDLHGFIDISKFSEEYDYVKDDSDDEE